MIYLASPYWDPDPFVRETRARENADAAARLAVCNVLVFSPLVHGHNVSELDPFHDIAELYWLFHGLAMLRRCDEVWVLNLNGWDRSRGVATEISEAVRVGKPHHLLNYDTLGFIPYPKGYDPLKIQD